MRNLVYIAAILLLLSAMPVASAGMSGSQEPPATMPEADALSDRVSLEQAVRQVRQRYGGRILSAETRGSGDRRQHVIKVLTDDGQVHTVRIRAN